LKDGDRRKWHPTVLVGPHTGHGMFSGTGFFTKDGRPAIIYHGQGSGRNQMAFGLDGKQEKVSGTNNGFGSCNLFCSILKQ
jgi:hypothetical protein